MQSRFLGQNIPKLQWRKGPGGARLIQTDFSHPEWQLWEYFLVWLALLASYPSSGFKALLYSAQLIKRGTQIAGIKATNISPATARVQQVKPLDNRDGISQMNWITPRNSAWLTGEQGQELGVLLPPTLLLTLDLGSVITVQVLTVTGEMGVPIKQEGELFCELSLIPCHLPQHEDQSPNKAKPS